MKMIDIGRKILYAVYSSSLSKVIGYYQNTSLLKAYGLVRIFISQIYYKIKSRKLLNYYQHGLLNDQILNNLTYANLNALLHSVDVDLFKKIADTIYSADIERIKQKEKIHIVFFCNTDSVWSCERLYHLLEKNQRFDVSIIVPGFNNGTSVTIREMYENTMKYFRENEYKVIGLFDNKAEITSWNDIGIPDIVFHLTPYTNMLPNTMNILTLPLSTINLHIPYALAADSIKWWFNCDGFLLSWKQFIESEISAEVYSNCSILGDYNIVVSGHPKTDKFFSSRKTEYVWKTPDNILQNDVIKIIYAPHHSIFNYNINFSTFHLNFREMYQYARDHPNSTSWIIRPHPLLKKASVELGLFKNEAEFDSYLAKWDALPNARSVTTGDYTDMFITSDAMITDCGSFITEYQYVHKPLIILTRSERVFDKPSKYLLDGLYMVPGTDIEKIYETINTVLLNGNDYLKEKRDALFDKYLDIRNNSSGGKPSDNIYNYLMSVLSK